MTRTAIGTAAGGRTRPAAGGGTRRWGRALRLLALQLVVPVVLLAGIWWWTGQAGSFYFPPASEVARYFADLWLFERVGGDVLPSLGRMFAGYAIAVVVGMVLGTALGLSRLLRTAADPVVQFLRALPPPALIPFALLLFGAGDWSKVFIIALGTVWPILLNTIDGVRGVESQLLDAARSFQIPAGARLTRIVLPAATPRIFAGMRTSLSIAIILMVVSEMVASDNGIGYFVLESQRSFAIPEMWTGIVLLGVLGFVLNWLFVVMEARVLFWHRGLKGNSDA
ncbi:ABC transporter permease [Nonomuraea jiangxiensis]|uniref:ABC-type nitrate/sulfonate/bicarbonate transport system, permease component n=1 Tax=Nonomuraea jiangxiensis TaxID=633440 RepID=A0A1G8W7J1_9ACTN|nr:ABC transporter permease [Nonomuraea jiangxiensis]SDJ74249.1 ABC-type nitrate/sulfonate/bicarbonate transport system, permease component [Nonomuraea jiangxiensis]